MFVVQNKTVFIGRDTRRRKILCVSSLVRQQAAAASNGLRTTGIPRRTGIAGYGGVQQVNKRENK